MGATLALTPALAGASVAANLRSHPGPAVQVAAALYLNDVAEVDDAHQRATVDLALRLSWRDPRLAGRSAEPTVMSPEDIWIPRYAIMNDRGLTPKLPEQALVFPDGTVRYVQRYVGEVAFPTDLADFPLDRQRLGITVLFLTLPGEVELAVDRSVPPAAPRFSLPGWSTRPPTIATASGSIFSPAHRRLVLELPMRRQGGYYLWTMVLPLALVVVMGMMPFWIEPNIEARVGLGATSVLTLIAFRFALSQMVPPLPYLTRLDAFVLSATLLVFLSLVGVAAMSALAASGRGSLAARIERVAQVFLPTALLLSGVLSLARSWR